MPKELRLKFGINIALAKYSTKGKEFDEAETNSQYASY
jgi:hypothetical protein